MSRAAFLAVAALPLTAQDPPRKLTLDAYLDWETVASPSLSPDGARVLFTRTWNDKVNDVRKSELWLVEADGSRPRALVEGSGAEWSPDGTRIAYLAEGKPRGTQVFVLWVATRETTQVTRTEEAPRNLEWSPDGKRIAFQMTVPEEETWKPKLPKPPKDGKWVAEPKVITRLSYRRDGQGYRPSGWSHLFVVDADGGTPRQVTRGDFDHGAPQWTTDGTALVCDGLRADDADWQWRESEIYKIDVATGEALQLTRRKGPDHNPVVSPDGRHVAYTGFDHCTDSYRASQISVVGTDGSGERMIFGIDRDPQGLRWVDASTLAFTLDSSGARQLCTVKLDSTLEFVAAEGNEFFTLGDARGDSFVGVLSTPERPADVVLIRKGGARTRLTRVNDDVLHGRALGAQEELEARSGDGLELQGWLVKPPDFAPGRKYPLILQIHGGPHAMYNVGFDFERQNHAAEGYLLLYGNPRGSTGYGSKFGNAIQNAYPGKDYDDLMALVDAAIAKGCVDEQQLYVYGGSGGGVLTAWIVGHTHRFRAAVSMFPVVNWISFVGTTDGASWYRNFQKLPWEDITEHWNRSPLKYAANVKTPTLLITGELDLRTPMGQSEELYQALKFCKVETALVRIQDEYHGAGARHPSNMLRRIAYVRAWFQKHAPKAQAAPAAKQE
jgi:dipeptidyl aminopeptidase/acylaminoacyl peptidase